MKKFLTPMFAVILTAFLFIACQQKADTATVTTDDNSIAGEPIIDSDQFGSINEMVLVTTEEIIVSQLNATGTGFDLVLKFSVGTPKIIKFTEVNTVPTVNASNNNDDVQWEVAEDITSLRDLFLNNTNTPENLEVYMIGTRVMKIQSKDTSQATWEAIY